MRANCVGPGMLTDGMAALMASGDLDEATLEITRRNVAPGGSAPGRRGRGGVLPRLRSGRLHHRAAPRGRRRLHLSGRRPHLCRAWDHGGGEARARRTCAARLSRCIDLHVSRWTGPAPTPASAWAWRTSPHRRGGGRAHVVVHGPLVPDGGHGAGRGPHARGLHRARLRRRSHRSAAAPPPRHRRHLPPPRAAGKTVTTLDVVSGGRAELGSVPRGTSASIAARRPVPPVAERFERLEEAIQICLQMWSDDDGPYVGTHYRLEETLCRPAPVSTPRLAS